VSQPIRINLPDESSTDWHVGPNALLSPTDSGGNAIATPQDHRWLWHLEGELSLRAPLGSPLDFLRRRLRSYLNETCQHHWTDSEGDEVIPAHRQCLWCCDVEWTEDGAS
jgi:hypothetical protein